MSIGSTLVLPTAEELARFGAGLTLGPKTTWPVESMEPERRKAVSVDDLSETFMGYEWI